MNNLTPRPLTPDAFSAYGEVLETSGHQPIAINNGNCQRFSDLVSLDIDRSGKAGVSLFDAKPYADPLTLRYVERHPLGSQAFFPTSTDPYLIVVAADSDGIAVNPVVFVTSGYQGVNYHRNTWHGVLTPVVKRSLFVVVDYIGEGDNLDECHFDNPFIIDFSAVISR